MRSYTDRGVAPLVSQSLLRRGSNTPPGGRLRDSRTLARVGIFGGTFDPIHKGHLALIRAARRKLGLDKVIIVPSNITPLKGKSLVSAKHRAAMVRLAIKPLSHVELSSYEMKKKRVSYTVDTLRYFKKKYPKTEIYFLAGSDVLKKFHRWKSPGEVLKLARFAVTQRAGSKRALPPGFVGFAMKPAHISSSAVRKGRPVHAVLPKSVQRYIRDHGLYGNLK